jgi:hypothetical protein
MDKKKDFIDDLITGSCDEDCFKQCFEITKDKYLCGRFGLTKLLKLTQSAQKNSSNCPDDFSSQQNSLYFRNF